MPQSGRRPQHQSRHFESAPRTSALPRSTDIADRYVRSEKCRLCCKTLFGSLKTNFPSRGCGDRIIMWGTTPPCVKLTGDSGNGFEAALIGDCRLFRLFAENYSHSVLELLQHNLPEADIGQTIRSPRRQARAAPAEPQSRASLLSSD